MRGQATTELALGALVFITLILFGIHFAEVGMLSLKVQESAAYATWEATGRRVLDLDNFNDNPFDQVVSGADAVGPAATRAYRDFNGLTSVDRGNNVVMRALTTGSGLTVTCRKNPGIGWAPSSTAARAYIDTGGMECSATAQLKAAMPVDFLNTANGLFSAKQYDARGAATGGLLNVCSMGRAVSGLCTGQLPVLLGDWGLAGEPQKGECKLSLGSPLASCVSTTSPPNDPYKDTLKRTWSPSFSKSKSFAQTYAGAAPADPNEFWFSYSGLEDDYETSVGGEGLGTFLTGGPGLGTLPDKTVVADCFLGKPGC
jgi:hypothetical protein